MGAVIPLRLDFDAPKLRGLVQRSRDSARSRRLLALAVICDDHRRSDAGLFAGVGLQIIRDWVLRFNAEGPEGLKDRIRKEFERIAVRRRLRCQRLSSRDRMCGASATTRGMRVSASMTAGTPGHRRTLSTASC